jgi:hypothetical protein
VIVNLVTVTSAPDNMTTENFHSCLKIKQKHKATRNIIFSKLYLRKLQNDSMERL